MLHSLNYAELNNNLSHDKITYNVIGKMRIDALPRYIEWSFGVSVWAFFSDKSLDVAQVLTRSFFKSECRLSSKRRVAAPTANVVAELAAANSLILPAPLRP